MSGAKVSTIRASLGALQHLRQQPAAAPSTPGMQVPAYPDTRVPEVAPAVSGHKVGKRSHPDYSQVKVYVLRKTKKAAMKKVADDARYEDFSALVEELLQRYVHSLLD